MVRSQEVRNDSASSGSSLLSWDLVLVEDCRLVSLGTPHLNVLLGLKIARERILHPEAIVLFRLRKEASRWSSSLYQDRQRLGNCEPDGRPFCLFWFTF